VIAALCAAAAGGPAGAQDPVVQPPAIRPGAAPGAPNQIQVQEVLDGWALVEGQRVLQLTDDQSPNFVARYMTLQRVRRRANMERQRAMREMQALVQDARPERDRLLTERLAALDELQQRAAQEIRKAVMALDGILSPVQRVRFRQFEERLELRKLELLNTVGRGRGAEPGPGPRRGGGGVLR
jgi:hypothetical protein